MSAATEQLSCSIREIAGQAHRTNAVVETASEEANRTNKDVAGLASAAEEIGSIVAVIRGIADQTNLLALNATIEAARAGEAGRGFAVVAAEVKELSAQTAKATDAIADHIDAIQSATGTAVSAIQSVSAKVAEIQTFTGAIAAAVEEQTAAAQEIASNVMLAAEASEKASASSSEVSKTAVQTKAQAASVSTVSARLADVSTDFSTAVSEFLAAVAEDIVEFATGRLRKPDKANSSPHSPKPHDTRPAAGRRSPRHRDGNRQSVPLFRGRCDELDLHMRAGGQRRDPDAAARGVGRLEERLVDLVHGGEIAHVGEKHVRLHDIAHAQASGGEHRRNPLQQQLRLRRNPAFHELVRGRVDAELARQIKNVPRPNGA